MGIIDSNKFSVTCADCGVSEDAAVHQKGSAYGASWQDGPDLKHFDARWSDNSAMGPSIEAATCRTCGETAQVKQTGMALS
jgi:hypothetical protein